MQISNKVSRQGLSKVKFYFVRLSLAYQMRLQCNRCISARAICCTKQPPLQQDRNATKNKPSQSVVRCELDINVLSHEQGWRQAQLCFKGVGKSTLPKQSVYIHLWEVFTCTYALWAEEKKKTPHYSLSLVLCRLMIVTILVPFSSHKFCCFDSLFNNR